MHCLSSMSQDSMHAEIMNADAQGSPSYIYGNWAGGIVKQYSCLGMVSPFLSSGMMGLKVIKFQLATHTEGQLCKVLGGLMCS